MTRTSRALCALNRVIVTLLAIVGLAVAAELLVAPDAVGQALSVEAAALRGLPIVTWISIGAIVGVISLLVLIVELSVGRGRRVFEARVDGGTVEYSPATVGSAVANELEDITGVLKSRVAVQGHRQRVDLYVRLTTDPQDDAQAIAARASTSVHDRISSLGLEVGNLRLAVEPGSSRGPAPEARRTVAA